MIRRKGLTLISVLAVIVVIAVLASAMMFSSTEAESTARATKILTDLQTLKRAAIAWYLDNRDKVATSNGKVKGKDVVSGMVIINDVARPIQEWGEDDIQLSRYISGGNKSDINLHGKTKQDKNTGNSNTNLEEGTYGICDGGTVKDSSKKVLEYHRSAWYVGYCFKKGEDKVRDKIRSMMSTTGVFLGTADAHLDTYNDNSAAVWLRVF